MCLGQEWESWFQMLENPKNDVGKNLISEPKTTAWGKHLSSSKHNPLFQILQRLSASFGGKPRHFLDQNPFVLMLIDCSMSFEGTLYVFSSINEWFGQICLFYVFLLQSPTSFGPESCAAKPKSHSLKISAHWGPLGWGLGCCMNRQMIIDRNWLNLENLPKRQLQFLALVLACLVAPHFLWLELAH